MEYTVYGDVLFLLNFSIDFICMCISLYICKLKRRILPIFISSLLGGIYAVISLFLTKLPTFAEFFVHIGVLFIISSISTPAKDSKTVIKVSFIFFFLCALAGGILTSVFSQLGKYTSFFGGIYADVSGFTLFLSASILFALSVPFFIRTGNRISQKTAKVKIFYSGKSFTVESLIDTGNLLSDPISGDSVILVKGNFLQNLFNENQLKAIKDLDVLSEFFPKGIRFISSDKGLIPVFRPKETEIYQFGKNGKQVSALVGIDFSKGTFGGAFGLLPSRLI